MFVYLRFFEKGEIYIIVLNKFENNISYGNNRNILVVILF